MLVFVCYHAVGDDYHAHRVDKKNDCVADCTYRRPFAMYDLNHVDMEEKITHSHEHFNNLVE